MSVIEKLLANNARYAASFEHGELTSPPALRLAIVTCMDARLDVHRILGIAEGDAHVIRNAGGIVSEDALRSLVISQRLLGTTEVAVIHHSDCGMLKFRDDDVKDQIEVETGVRPPFALGAFTDLVDNVRESVALIKASPFIPHKDRVRGFVYDCATGKLSEVCPAGDSAG